jgi:hypothetical protein
MDEPVHDEGTILNPEVRYERSDVSFKAIVWFGVAMLVAGVVIHAGLWWMLKHWRDTGLADKVARYGQETPVARQRPQEPQLEGLNPLAEMRTWRSPAQAQLRRYDWVDRRTGVVRIPIDRAMEMVAAGQVPSKEAKPTEGAKK